MKPEIKESIYSQLKGAQEEYGGYTGKDIAILSEKFSIENARASIQTRFSFRDLKNTSITGCHV